MLVLTRKINEKIRIGDAVVTVLRLTGNRVRLGIEAPNDTQVVRGELDQAQVVQPPQPSSQDG